jgi:hypothetical protein
MGRGYLGKWQELKLPFFFSLSNLKTHKKHNLTGFWELEGVNG